MRAPNDRQAAASSGATIGRMTVGLGPRNAGVLACARLHIIEPDGPDAVDRRCWSDIPLVPA